MSDTIECPYCNQKFDVNHPVYSITDSQPTTVQCDCGKQFIVTCVRIVDYECEKDCALNNETCEPTINPNAKLTCCAKCGELMPEEKTNV